VSAFASDLTPEVRAVQDKQAYKPHLGVKLGIADPEGSADAAAEVSATIGFQPVIPFSVGLESSFVKFNDDPSGLERTSLMVYGNYNFGGDIPIIKHSYVGVSAGPAWENEKNDEGLALVWVHTIGFDQPLTSLTREPLTIGASASYLISTRSTPDSLNLAGVIKYWY